jgi:hypothetical protein
MSDKSQEYSTVPMSSKSVLAFLVDLFGFWITAHLVKTDASTIRSWVNDIEKLPSEAEKIFRETQEIIYMLLSYDSSDTVRAWFMGMNPLLGDQSPVAVIAAGDFAAVKSAARTHILN